MTKHVVPMAGMVVAKDPADEIITYALGSCLGVTIYDPVARVGGMLHAMLPLAHGESSKDEVAKYVDTGVPALFQACFDAGAQRGRVIVKVAGGAAFAKAGDESMFQIGSKNMVMLRKVLWKYGVMLRAHDVGGDQPRTMTLALADGKVTIKNSAAQYDLG